MQLKSFIKQNTWSERSIVDVGWGNGYVILPREHPLYKKDYDEIHQLYPELEVHRGLTFSDFVDEIWLANVEYDFDIESSWVVGFDTCHLEDTFEKWSKEKVEEETEKLRIQLENYVSKPVLETVKMRIQKSDFEKVNEILKEHKIAFVEEK